MLDRIMGVTAAIVSILVLGYLLVRWNRDRALKSDLAKRGVVTQARILELHAEGGDVAYQGVEALLEVQPEGRPSYRARARFKLAFLDVPRYQPGTQVSVRVDPVDPSRVGMDDSWVAFGRSVP